MKRRDWWGGVLPFGFGLRSRLTALGRARRWPEALQAAPVLGVAPVLLLLAGTPKTAKPPDLVLDLSHGGYTGDPMDLHYKDAPVPDVLHAFRVISGWEIEVEPSAEPVTISLAMTEVPWDQMLELIAKTQNAGLVLRQGAIHWVPMSEVRPAGDDAGPRTTVFRTFPDATSAALAERLVTAALSSRGSVRRDPTSISLLINDVRWRLDALAPVLSRLAGGTQVPAPADGRVASVAIFDVTESFYRASFSELQASDLVEDAARRTGRWSASVKRLSSVQEFQDRARRASLSPIESSVTVKVLRGQGAEMERAAESDDGPPCKLDFRALGDDAAAKLDVSVTRCDGWSRDVGDFQPGQVMVYAYPLNDQPDMAGLAVLVVTQDGGHS